MKEFLEWLERVLPGILAAFGLGYSAGSKDKKSIQAELDASRLREELKQNEIDNEKDFSGKSDTDIIKSVFGRKPES